MLLARCCWLLLLLPLRVANVAIAAVEAVGVGIGAVSVFGISVVDAVLVAFWGLFAAYCFPVAVRCLVCARVGVVIVV